MELLQVRTGIKLQLVPYAGGPAQAMNDVMSGRVPLVLDGYAGLAPALKGNLIKGLASTALKRPPGFEDLPTMAETVPGFLRRRLEHAAGAGRHARRRSSARSTPTCASRSTIRTSATKLAANGGFVRHMTPAEVTAFVQNEQKTWRPILEQVAKEADEEVTAERCAPAASPAKAGDPVTTDAFARTGCPLARAWQLACESPQNNLCFASSAACSIVMNTAPSLAS